VIANGQALAIGHGEIGVAESAPVWPSPQSRPVSATRAFRLRPPDLHRRLELQSAKQGLYLLFHMRAIMQDSDDPIEALQIGDNDFGRDRGIEGLW
jgi:hypothetical protein